MILKPALGCWAIAAVFLSVGQSSNWAQSPTSMEIGYQPVVGQPHPDFELPNINDNKRVKLSDVRGKKVLLLHFASW